MTVDTDIPDFDLLGELDAVVEGNPAAGSDADAAANICKVQQAIPVAAPRPIFRLPSLALTAAKASAACSDRGSGSGTAPNGCLPLLSRDMNGSCSRDQSAAAGSNGSSSGRSDSGDGGGLAPPCIQQPAVRRGAFKAPRLQPPSERPASRLPAATRPDAQHSSKESAVSVPPDDGQPGLGAAADEPQPTDSVPKRQARRGSNDTRAAARGSAAAQPVEVTPPSAPEQRRQSSSSAKAPRRTSGGKRPPMRRMYTDEDPLADPPDAEERALLEADLPADQRTPVPMQQWMQDEPSSISNADAQPARSFKRLRKAGAAPQARSPQAAQLATMAAQPTSVAQQLGRIPAAAASGRRDAGAVASAAFTFDTPTPDSRRSHNPFVKSSRKASKPVRLVEAAPASSVPAGTLRGIMSTAHNPGQELNGSEDDDWPEATWRVSSGGASGHAGGGSGAAAAAARPAQRRQSVSAAAPARRRLASDGGATAACGVPAVAAECRAAAEAAGIDLTLDDDEDDDSAQWRDPPQQQQSRVSRGQPAARLQQQWGAADSAGAGHWTDRRAGQADGAAAPAERPLAEAAAWRQQAAGSSWRADLPGGSCGAADGGEAWYSRLPDYVPVGAINMGRDPRNGDAVYVDYLRQFSGENAPRAARGTAKKAAGGAAAGGGGCGGTVANAESRQGRWVTQAGTKVYYDARGKRLTSSAAHKASEKAKKEAGGGGGASVGGGVRKRNAKGGDRKPRARGGGRFRQR